MEKDTQISKRLSWLLRHGAIKEGLDIQTDGFVRVDSITEHPKFKRDFTLEVLKNIVAKDKKQRYSLRQNNNGFYEIRANQGHSIAVVQDSHCLQRIYNASEVNLAVHGTYYRNWQRILKEGLRTMKRLHIHFSVSDKVEQSGSKDIILSGFRSDCEILIYLNVQKAIQVGGMEIYRSTNNVILCSGINGCIPKLYFSKVIDRRTGTLLPF
uniref:2'-phosphotransferase n=1 Tax=Ceratitis capitata TaxID=7213 RepID=W8C327_CERCA